MTIPARAESSEPAPGSSLSRADTRVVTIVLVVLLALPLVAVGSLGYFVVQSRVPPPNVTGNWAMRISGLGSAGLAQMTLFQYDNVSALSGSIIINGLVGSQSSQGVVGDISGSAFGLDVIGQPSSNPVQSAMSLHLDGSLSDATHMSGTWTLSYANGDGRTTAQSGTWRASKSKEAGS
jgi:hypothetical protein